jgi:hypothetical protein
VRFVVLLLGCGCRRAKIGAASAFLKSLADERTDHFPVSNFPVFPSLAQVGTWRQGAETLGIIRGLTPAGSPECEKQKTCGRRFLRSGEPQVF